MERLNQRLALARRALDTFAEVLVEKPSAIQRDADAVKSLSPEQAAVALAMADDRNLTVHTYNEGLADQIYAHLRAYHRLMAALPCRRL